MTKVYIVTSCEYSDYSIDKVFIDESVAKNYVEFNNKYDNSYEHYLEVYDLNEVKKFKEVNYVLASYEVNTKNNTFELEIDIEKTNNIDWDESISNTTVYQPKSRFINEVYICRLITNENYDEEFIKNKYKKVLHDLMDEVNHLLSLGFSEYDINNQFKNNLNDDD